LFGLDIKDVNYACPNGVTNLVVRQRPAEEPGVENRNPEGRPDV
jgi:hypothetical protein